MNREIEMLAPYPTQIPDDSIATIQREYKDPQK